MVQTREDNGWTKLVLIPTNSEFLVLSGQFGLLLVTTGDPLAGWIRAELSDALLHSSSTVSPQLAFLVIMPIFGGSWRGMEITTECIALFML